MATEVIMPKVDMVMETGTFVEWLKQEGEHVNKGDPLFVIDTDKAAIEMESPADGILSGVRAKLNDVIPVTEVIAYILAPGEELPGKPVPQQVVTIPAPQAAPAPEPALAVAVANAPAEGKVRVTPVARRLAQELRLDLTQIAGRGPKGRIHKADVLAFRESQSAVEHRVVPVAAPAPIVSAPSATPIPAGQPARIPLPEARRKQVLPLTGARKIIAERMAYSTSTIPHFTVSLHVNMTEVIRLREQVLEPLQAQTGQRVSFTAILARAVTTVLPHHPYMNASLSDGNLILWEDIHLGIATSVEENLIVPVIREAQSKNLGQIVTALADLTDRARNRRLTPLEMTGSTFTISNLGMFGIESFTAIINPPESAILAVGKLVDTPVKNGDGFTAFRPMIQLTVSADHRILDGVAAARFLDELKSTLENPYLLI
ncbi:MAG TPA: dihydrolipoamide acetyltransferase family protein [Anaerolineales bacterium]|nr:dihydrolipoamide acetyltransferase family protein [Anaerolineales bacterium]